MADSIKNHDSVSESARRRDGVSPLPWRVIKAYDDEPARIIDADDDEVAVELIDADAALIVEAVNNFAPFSQDRIRLIGELDSVKAQLDWHKWQLKAVKADAESEERWANQYFEQAQNAEAEANRLRDLVRRMIPHVNDLKCHTWLYDFVKGIDCETDPKVLEMNALIDEAREALGEHEP